MVNLIAEFRVNAIHAGSMDQNPERWKVTQLMLKREIAKAKAEHSEEKSKRRRRIGFLPG